ncbi:MAG: preprotein translocase subunit SecG [Alphaproteobacteria bacterium]|nr:preprotein translocase subunit SecG [Alphaproteobacteria bacterium]
METVLLVVQVLVCAALIVVILIQRSDTDGFGLGSGSGANVFSGRGKANFMTRLTSILAAIFIINSLVLGILAARSGPESLVDTIKEQESGEPSVPLAIDEVKKETKKSAPKAADDVKKEEKTPEVPKAE